jgi:hypothetical protein
MLRTRLAMPIPPVSRFLGVLDTSLSLAQADAQLAQSSNRTLAYTIAAMLIVAVLSGLFILARRRRSDQSA